MTPRDCDAYPDLRAGRYPGGEGVNDPACGGVATYPEAIVTLQRDGRDVGAALAAWIEAAADTGGRLARLLPAADVLLRQGTRDPGLARLREAMALGRAEGRFDLLPDQPQALARLCAQALEADIEPCYVRRLIAGNKLGPPSPNLSRWPYPVRIQTLGGWAVEVRGQPLRFSGKARRRPLFLLHSLLARGGRPVPVALLRKAMGDDGEGDGPCSRGAFDMALSRLRQLLSLPGLLRLEDGLLALDEERCWVDAWACERLLGLADAHPECGRGLLERTLRLYEGEFLAGQESAWVVLARERLRARLLRVARRVGEDLEARGRWAEAGELYERLREGFPLDEDLCLHLIRSHVRREQYAQASSLYARCRELLARVLGVLPNPAIRVLLEPAS